MRRTRSACCARAASGRDADSRDELAPFCMTKKEHAERRRGLGHDRLTVATGSPQPFRIASRE
jgi:hypothetical protein